MELDLKDLRRLLRLLEKRDISEFEFEDERIRLRLVRGGPARSAAMRLADEAVATAGSASAVAISTVAALVADDVSIAYVTSPFVGTFYRSPSPDAPTFVEIGSAIREGQALCIVEAM